MKKLHRRVISSFWLLTVLWWGSVAIPAAVCREFSYPPEWEPHDAIWLGFRTFDEGLRHEALLQEIIRSLAPHVRVKVLIEDISLLPEGEGYFPMIGVDPARIDIIVQKPLDFWIRDPGPLFLVKAPNNLAVADFLFSNYADVEPRLHSSKAVAHGTIDTAIAEKLGLRKISSRAVLEGGAFEVNGAGTILVSAMTRRRNPHLSVGQLEEEILRTLGQKKIIWLKEGLAEDPRGLSRIVGRYWGRGAGGHVDEFVRFVNENTVLLAWPPGADGRVGENPVTRITRLRMSENEALLRQATNQDGKVLNIVHFPVPEPMVTPHEISSDEAAYFQQQDPSLQPGDLVLVTGAASYLNYVITNNVILLPAYWHDGLPEQSRQKDEQARNILKRYFPDRTIIQLDPASLNFLGGGMHCITMQQPRVQ